MKCSAVFPKLYDLPSSIYIPFLFNLVYPFYSLNAYDAFVCFLLISTGFSYEATTTGRMMLPQREQDFGRGNTDTFDLVGPDVGTPTRLIIGHNGSGTASDW